MRPHEFWHEDLTPSETSIWIEEYSKQGIIMAWNFAAMNSLAKTKKFPKSPLELIGDKRRLPTRTDAQSVAHVKSYFEALEKAEAKNKTKRIPK